MKKITHKKLGIDYQVKDIGQKTLEEWVEDFNSRPSEGRVQYDGAAVRAALAVGWIPGDPSDVDNMSPAATRYISQELDKIYLDLVEIPPN